jgi:hypothetical protein
MSMLGTALPCAAHPIDALREEHSEESKEDPGNFQPENTAGMDKGSPESLAEALCASRRGAPGFLRLARSGSKTREWSRGSGACLAGASGRGRGHRRWSRLRLRRRRFGRSRRRLTKPVDTIAQHISSHPHSDA